MEITVGKRNLSKYNVIYMIAEELLSTGIQTKLPYQWFKGRKVDGATTTFLVSMPVGKKIVYTLIQSSFGAGRKKEMFVITPSEIESELVFIEGNMTLVKGHCQIEPDIEVDMDRYSITTIERTKTKLFRRVK